MTTRRQRFHDTRQPARIAPDWESIGRLVRSETMRAVADHFAAMAEGRADTGEPRTTERDRT